MATAIALFTALVLLGACVVTAYYLSALFTSRDRLSLRWCGTVIVASWLVTVMFYALAWSSAFRIWIAVPLWLLLAMGLHASVGRWRGYDRLLASDLARVWALTRRPLPPRVAVAIAVAITVVSFRVLRGLVAPPLAWDSLTYHFVKAARWVQHGGWAQETAPDAWSYYEFFPAGGDLLWAWAMLPAHSDTLLGVAGLLVWLACVLGAYGAANVMNVPRREALVTALALAAMPCIAGYLTSGYVMTFLLAQLLLAFTFVLLVLRSGRIGHAVLASAALALAAGVQATAWPLVVLGTGTLIVAVWRHHPRRAAWRAIVLCGIVGALALGGYLHTWIQTGSPLYPMGLTFAGRTLAVGNEQLEWVLRGEYLHLTPAAFVPSEFLVQLFTGPPDSQLEHLNFGPGAIGLAILGVAAAGPMLRDKRQRGATIVLLVMASISLAALFSDEMVVHRTKWAPMAGRFLTPTVAALAVVGATVPGPVAAWMRVFAVVGGAAYAIPRGVSDADWTAMSRLGLFILAGASIVLLSLVLTRVLTRPIRLVRRSRVPRAAAARGARSLGERGRAVVPAAAVVAWLVVSFGLESTRAAFRYPIYRAAAGKQSRLAYDVHPLLPPYAAGWPIWAHLDGERPQRIAFVAGWDDFVGHNWYRYPLLGSRLQNSVVYVPPARDGQVIDYKRKERLIAHADLDAWVRRLIEQRVDVVVAAPPDAPELAWMRNHSNMFVQMSTGADGRAVAFRFMPPRSIAE